MGAQARANEFSRGRDEGLEIAIRIIEAGGTAEDLRAEIRFRERSGISMGLSHKELDKASERIKLLTYGTMRIAMAASIADSYGFGAKRIQKALDCFSKLTEYMDSGWVYWLDMVEDLKVRYHLDLSLDGADECLRHYSRPEPEDLWEEPDLVRKEDWEAILELAGLQQGISKDGHPCVLAGGIPLIEYRDRYQQVDAYSMIQGILLERELRAEAPPMEGRAEAAPPARRKKRRKK